MWTYHYLTQRQGRDYHYSIMLLSAITKMFCIGQRSQWPKKSPSFFLYRSYCIKDVCICMNGLSYEETTTAEPNTSLTYLNRYFLVKYHFCHFTYVTLQLFFGIKMHSVLSRNWFIDIFGLNISLNWKNTQQGSNVIFVITYFRVL